MTIPPFAGSKVFRCGCVTRTYQNVTELNPNGVNGTTTKEVIGHTYKSGRRWDGNAENHTLKYDNTLESGNAYSNSLDILNNAGVAPPQGKVGRPARTQRQWFDTAH